MNETEIIQEARELLASGRWTKGVLQDGKGNHCIVGALYQVGGTEHPWATVAAENALNDHAPDNERWSAENKSALVMYNDAANTTLQDMLDLMDKTLADLGGLG